MKKLIYMFACGLLLTSLFNSCTKEIENLEEEPAKITAEELLASDFRILLDEDEITPENLEALIASFNPKPHSKETLEELLERLEGRDYADWTNLLHPSTKTEFRRAKQGNLPNFLYIPGCETLPCRARRGEWMEIVFAYRIDRSVSHMKMKSLVTSLGKTIQHPTLEDFSVVNTQFPCGAGEDIIIHIVFPVLTIYAKARWDIEMQVLHGATNEILCAFLFSWMITD